MGPRRDVLVAHQPAYLPWPGYFSRLIDVERLVLLDHVQFSERGWQHRNWVRGPNGVPVRLTVPVAHHFGQRLNQARIADDRWRARHWRTLRESYTHAPYWSAYEEPLRAVYQRSWIDLTDLTSALLRIMLDGLELPVELVTSTSLRPVGTKTAMLIDLCRKVDAQILRVGSGALKYLDGAALAEAGVMVEVARYNPVDLGGPRTAPPLSALDLLLQHGPDARDHVLDGGSISSLPIATAAHR